VTTTNDRSQRGAEAGELFTVDQLAEISQNPDPVAFELAGDLAALVPEMKKAGITTKLRVAAFLGNVCHETDNLKTLEEYGDRAYFESFLGNQWMYHGRGYIMNTWRAAYERLGKVLGVDLVQQPDRLANDKELAAKAAVWFWDKGNVTGKSLNPYADQRNFKAVCSIINRGEIVPTGTINGWEDRVGHYQRALDVLTIGEPEPEPEPGGVKMLSHGVKDGTKFALGYKYVVPHLLNRKYWVWKSGIVPDGEGAYAVNRPLPDRSQIGRMFCAAVPNVFRRAAGKIIPTRGNPDFDGGIAAYFYTSAWDLGPGYFSPVDVPFHLPTAKKWARETESGVLIGRCYRNNTLSGQGHVAIVLPDGIVLQSFQFGADGEPGVNAAYTIEESHDGGYYEVMVHPSKWINYEGDEF
jgi:predicted chitinase